MTESQFYSLNDFNTILFDNFQYKLQDSVYAIINDLTLKLGLTTEKKDDFQRMRVRKSKSVSKIDETWEHIKPFKATVVIEKKEGTDKIMNDIRICLNKISARNYETNKIQMIEFIDSLLSNGENQLEKIANIIFDIASTNKFFSDIYAELYKSLIERFQIFRDVLDTFLERFTDSMRSIRYVEQTEDYDAFCKYNKMNDARKATSVFIVNLVKKNVLPQELLLKLIIDVQSIVLEYIELENKVNEVDEITENLFLLISESHSVMKTTEQWTSKVITTIQTLSMLKVKEKMSLSSRAIFKYMDIMDKMKV